MDERKKWDVSLLRMAYVGNVMPTHVLALVARPVRPDSMLLVLVVLPGERATDTACVCPLGAVYGK